ncbi:MAG TPA: type II toxin-antitoxin system HicB family antitoxin [Chthonomonadaceae bacterium]|nr:type II toxin-antitoxin system HicB family antitoxin [Chthonomonadaceae bacterium]
MKEYVVIYERGKVNWGAYLPDLPGCVAVGDTLEQVNSVFGEQFKCISKA